MRLVYRNQQLLKTRHPLVAHEGHFGPLPPLGALRPVAHVSGEVLRSGVDALAQSARVIDRLVDFAQQTFLLIDLTQHGLQLGKLGARQTAILLPQQMP